MHEQILPAVRRANVPVKWTDITVRHTGYTDRELRERKLQRDGKILEGELAERPNDPFVLINAGSIAVCSEGLSFDPGAILDECPGDTEATAKLAG